MVALLPLKRFIWSSDFSRTGEIKLILEQQFQASGILGLRSLLFIKSLERERERERETETETETEKE